MKKLAFAAFALIAGTGIAAAAPNAAGLCLLIGEMQSVFKVLRVLAFVGAGFMLAGWAWGWIAAGDVKKDDLKDKGVALLVGFTVLFGIGIILQFIGPITGCAVTGW